MKSVTRFIQLLVFICFFGLVNLVFKPTVYAIDCQESSGTANLTLSTSCAFAGTSNGVDNGSSKNTASLSVSTGTTLTVIPGQTVVAGNFLIGGGQIIVFDGAQLYPGGSLFMRDSDVDGYPSNTDRLALVDGAPAPDGYVRKSQIYAPAISDRNDALPCPDNAYNPTFVVPLCNVCYHGAPDLLPRNSSDLRCTQGRVCDGSGACMSTTKRVFISSTSYTGALGGLSGADSSCQSLSNIAVLGGSWKAWLSNTTTNASDRLTHSDSPYYLVDGTTMVANNWAGIVSGSLLTGITINEKFQTVAPGTRVWTNTSAIGTRVSTTSQDTCYNWTVGDGARGGYGLNERFGSGGWTDTNYSQCRNAQRLYCFEQ